MDKITNLIKTIWAMILNALVSAILGIIFSWFIIPSIDGLFDLRVRNCDELIAIIIATIAVQIFFFGERRNVFRSKNTKE